MKNYTASILKMLCTMALVVLLLPARALAAQPKLVSCEPLTRPLTEVTETITEEEFRQLDLVGSGGLDASAAAGTTIEDTGLFYTTLTGYGKLIYEALEQAEVGPVYTGTRITLSTGSDTAEEAESAVRKVWAAAMYAYQRDHQDQFHWATNRISISGPYGNDVYHEVSFSCTYVISNYYTTALGAQVDAVIDSVVSRCTATSRYDKVKYYHDWLVSTNVYDYPTSLLTGSTDTKDMYYAHSHVGCLINGKGVCESYAKAFKIFCMKADIPCVFVTSTGHAYNYVRMEDGKWYMVDCTWDDPLDMNHQDTGRVHYNYFLISNRPFIDSSNHQDDKALIYPKTSLGDYGDSCRWVLTEDQAPGCTTNGKMTKVCQDCGRVKTVTIPMLNHDFNSSPYVVTWASDYSTATITYTCENCGQKVSRAGTVTRTVRSQPTCASAGVADVTAVFDVELPYSDTMSLHPHVESKKTITIPSTIPHNYVNGTCTGCGKILSVNYNTNVTLSYTSCTYSGKLKKPVVTIIDASTGDPFVEGVHYKVEYVNNRNAGEAYARITGINGVGGELARYFTIKPKALTTSMTKLAYSTTTYTGNYKKPAVTVTNGDTVLTVDQDYRLQYETGRKNVGTYRVWITGIGNYTGEITKSFTIKPRTITSDMVKLAYTSTTYTGNYKKPAVTVTYSGKNLTSGVQYLASYASGRKLVGTYDVTITGIGNFTGTVTKTFKINPKPTVLTKLTAKTAAFTAVWEKMPVQVTGYQVQYSRYSDFHTAYKKTYSGASTLTKTISGLTSGRKYYVRVRVYKKVNDVNYYSKWSEVKTVTTK